VILRYGYQVKRAAARRSLERLRAKLETDHKREYCRVYAIQDRLGSIKVGTSELNSIESRFRSLQGNNSAPLTMLAHCRGSRITEKAIHVYIGYDLKAPGGGSEWYVNAALPGILEAFNCAGDIDLTLQTCAEFERPQGRINECVDKQLLWPSGYSKNSVSYSVSG